MRNISIGRDSSCDIVINNDRVSRFHASITPAGNGYIFRDTSNNGTRINGTMVRNSERPIRFGDQILLAGNIPLPWNRIQNMGTAGASQAYSNPQPYNESQPYGNVQVYNSSPYYPAESKSNGLGIAGFVLAIIALFLGWIPIFGWIIWVIGLILSFLGVSKTPKGLAIAGLIISLIDLILLLVVFAGIASMASLF